MSLQRHVVDTSNRSAEATYFMNMTFTFARQIAFKLLTLTTLALLPTTCQAALVVSGTTVLPGFPVQDLILSPGTPFNTGTSEVLLPDVRVFGSSVFDRAGQVGTTIEMSNGSFSGDGFYGDPAAGGLGNFTLRTGSANGFAPMTALLENVVQDPNHPGFGAGDPASIISADVTFVVPDWGVSLTDLGVELEVRDPFFFTGTYDGLPPSAGNQIADPFIGTASDRLEVFIAGTNTIIGFSANRRYIAAVPEPGCLGLLGFGACLLLRRRA